VIDVTDEMVAAYVKAWQERLFKPPQDTERPAVRAGLAAVLAIVERDQERSARQGYETAIAVLRDVAERTGSPAAAWCADYLLVDPDRLAPPPQ
jgi:hypothetical protein